MAGGDGGEKTGREVGVKSYWLLLEGNSEMGEEEEGQQDSRQLLWDRDIRRLPAVILESVTAGLSAASSIEGLGQPLSSTILLGTRDVFRD